MWTTVLVLAIAVNFEPTRIGLVPLMLSRQRPVLQLIAYLCGNVTMALTFGLLVLFVFERSPLGTSTSSGGRAQIIIGVIALAVAAALMLKSLHSSRNRKRLDANAAKTAQQDPAGATIPRTVDRMTKLVRSVFQRGNSPWLSGLVGVGVGLPSVDYLALLVVIATSRTSPPEQAAALITFLVIGNAVVTIPLISYLLRPQQTLEKLDKLGAWIRSRSRIDYAIILAAIGVLFIGLGWTHL